MYNISTHDYKHGDNMLVMYTAYKDKNGPYTRKFVDAIISQNVAHGIKGFVKRELTDKGVTTWFVKAGE